MAGFCADRELQLCYVFFGVVRETGIDPCNFHGVAAAFQAECVHMGKEFFVVYGGVLMGTGIPYGEEISFGKPGCLSFIVVLLFYQDKNGGKTVELSCQQIFPADGDAHLSQEHGRGKLAGAFQLPDGVFLF